MNKKTRMLLIAVMFVLSVMAGICSADTINRGLTGLTPYKYAKVYTLTSGRYYELYSDANLTNRLSSSHWTGEDDDVWLIGTGRTSRGVSYARIKYPVGNSRVEAYAKLQDLFVAGKLDAAPRQAKSGYYGMYKRKNEGRNFNWWIDPGDDVYLLTKENNWCQVMYPMQGNLWRIAWMPEADYNRICPYPPYPPVPPVYEEAARNRVVAHAEKILNYEWNSDEYILLYDRGATKNPNGTINFSGTPIVAKGKIRGVPYTLENGGGVDEVPFSTYESLSASDKQTLSNIYTYAGGNRLSMKYGMACATFVTDCIMQGLGDDSLSTYINIHIHDWAPGWGKYVTPEWSTSDAAYQKLKKGDYLYVNTSTDGHVILVVDNDGSSITYIDQTPPDNWGSCTNKTYRTGVTFKGVPGTYNAYQVCMECDTCKSNTIGTHKKERASYSWLRGKTYYPMYVTYPSTVAAPAITAYQPSSAAIAGQSYNFQCKADNDPTEWRVSEGTVPSGTSSLYICKTTIPPGMSINSSTGEISGTPESTSDGKSARFPLYYYFTVTASNAGGEDSKQSSIGVYEPPVITTNSTLADATEGTYFSREIKAEGTEFSMRWKKKSGYLPSGVSFTYNNSKRIAYIAGTPKSGTAGTYSFTIECSNAAGLATATKTFSLTVKGKTDPYPESNMWFTQYPWGTKNVCSFSNAGKVGTYYNSRVYIDTATAMYMSRLVANGSTVSVIRGQLPPGLSVALSGCYVYLRGTPTRAGMYTFTLRAMNCYKGYCEKEFTVSIALQGRIFRDSTMSTKWDYWPGKVGDAYSDYIRVLGGTAPYTAEVISGNLYTLSVSVNGNNIYVKGTPKRSEYNFTLRITGAHGGYVDKACTITMAANKGYMAGFAANYESKTVKPKILTAKIPNAAVGNEWSATLEANGTHPIRWTHEEAGWPEGFILTEEGRLSGIPSEMGKLKFKVIANNSAGQTKKTYTLTVKGEKPSVVPAELPFGVVKKAYSIVLEAEGSDPITWSKSGSFPKGLKLNSKTGEITGKPTKAGTYNFTVKAKNKAGNDSAQFQIVVYSEEPDKDTLSDDSTVTASFVSRSEDDPDYSPNAIFVISGDEEIDGEITAEPGTPLTFGILGWTDEYGYEIDDPDVEILIDGQPADGVYVNEDGTFTLPAGTFTVSARAVSGDTEMYSDTVTVRAESQSAESETEAEFSGNESAGCSSGFAGMMLLSLLGFAVARRK